jgi:hypothetical protein
MVADLDLGAVPVRDGALERERQSLLGYVRLPLDLLLVADELDEDLLRVPRFRLFRARLEPEDHALGGLEGGAHFFGPDRGRRRGARGLSGDGGFGHGASCIHHAEAAVNIR